MWEWLLSSIDPGRAHLIDAAISWHGRIMVLAWGVLVPCGIMAARFLKVVPWQDFPRELDNQLWWRLHLIGQCFAVLLSMLGVYIVWEHGGDGGFHGVLGYAVTAIGLAQLFSGFLRGSKGGPTAPAKDGSIRGDHYDMTPRRLAFEVIHKTLGYGALALVAWALISGLWLANAPRWMWIAIGGWWMVLLGLGVYWQSRGLAVDTYQAIWGSNPVHPGNRRKAQGWGMRRVKNDKTAEDGHVRGH
ncbi:MAG: cytochrome b561 domain-containing protein [Pseudomonadota bacterium]